MPRRKLIAANWKMYKNPGLTREFMHAFVPEVHDHQRDAIVICAPFVCLPALAEEAKDTNIAVGGQDMYWEQEGAFTGEISAPMLLSVGCTYVIVGHSERRQFFGETDETVNRKLKRAITDGLTPIVCVGEMPEEREAGLTEDVLRRQCTRAFDQVTAEDAAKMVIAYEPVWAIGTGKTATPQLAAEAHRIIRAQAAQAFGNDVANAMNILYGGSVKPDNAASLMSEPEIDGALVGGASLDPRSFARIVRY